jgi:hypothetical protein
MKKEGQESGELGTMGGASQVVSEESAGGVRDHSSELGTDPLSLEALGNSIGKDCSKEPHQYIQESNTGQSGE